jgi:hypothetical protein
VGVGRLDRCQCALHVGPRRLQRPRDGPRPEQH